MKDIQDRFFDPYEIVLWRPTLAGFALIALMLEFMVHGPLDLLVSSTGSIISVVPLLFGAFLVIFGLAPAIFRFLLLIGFAYAELPEPDRVKADIVPISAAKRPR